MRSSNPAVVSSNNNAGPQSCHVGEAETGEHGGEVPTALKMGQSYLIEKKKEDIIHPLNLGVDERKRIR
jgi:hypothetical protein